MRRHHDAHAPHPEDLLYTVLACEEVARANASLQIVRPLIRHVLPSDLRGMGVHPSDSPLM
jgi:hypothetical protein